MSGENRKHIDPPLERVSVYQGPQTKAMQFYVPLTVFPGTPICVAYPLATDAQNLKRFLVGGKPHLQSQQKGLGKKQGDKRKERCHFLASFATQGIARGI